MSNAIYPAFAGLAWPVKRTPMFNSISAESASGREIILGKMLYPRRKFTLKYAYLSQADVATMEGFFLARRGRADDFLFDDVNDNLVSTAQVFGVGNGSLTTFQLVRNVGGFTEPVYGIKSGTVTIRVNSVVVSNYTISSTGLVTFSTAPGNGLSIDWVGGFYHRVRFYKDSTEFEEFLYQFHQMGSVELLSFKP